MFDVDVEEAPLAHCLMAIARAFVLGFIVKGAFGRGLVFKLVWVP